MPLMRRSALRVPLGGQGFLQTMNVTVEIPTPLRRHTGGTAKISCEAGNLNELLSALDQKFPALKPHLRDESGQIRRFLNIYVNEEDIRFLGGESYAFRDGDQVLLVPSIAGGTREARSEMPLLPAIR
jgi:molybdopterin synthase sulfur carrier subunit